MKITRLGGTRPLVSIGSVISGGTAEGATESPAPSGQVPTSNGSNGVSWGSNVGTITVNGTTLVRGPFINIANGSNTTVTVDQVGSIASNTIRIHATGGASSFGSNSNQVSYANAPGASTDSSRADHVHLGVTSVAHSSNTYSGPVILAPGTNMAIISPTPGTFTLHSTGAGGGGGGGAPTTAKYVTTASDATLSAEVAIPGLAGSPDRLPWSPDADDDEFDTTDTTDPLTGWTTLGTLDGLNTNSTRLSHLYLRKAANSATRIDGIYKAQTPPFTVTAKMTASTIRGNYNRAGIFIGLATPGDIETCGIIEAATAQGEVLDMANPTTYTATLANLTLFAAGFGRALPWHLRIIVANSTDVTYQVSVDGSFWTTLIANRNPGFTVGSAGLFVNPQSASLDVEALFDWVRFT